MPQNTLLDLLRRSPSLPPLSDEEQMYADAVAEREQAALRSRRTEDRPGISDAAWRAAYGVADVVDPVVGSIADLAIGATVGADPYARTQPIWEQRPSMQELGEIAGTVLPVGAVSRGVSRTAGGSLRGLLRAVQGKLPLRGGVGTKESARQARAIQQGFNPETTVYHGTQVTKRPRNAPGSGRGDAFYYGSREGLTELLPSTGGLKMMDGMGIHVGTVEAATQRIEKNVGVKFGTGKRSRLPGQVARLEGAQIFPLVPKITKPFVKSHGGIYTETELQARLSNIAERLGFDRSDTREYSRRGASSPKLIRAQKAVKAHLQKQGYDAIPYYNAHEAPGSVSYVIFEPTQLRSTFAGFSPWMSQNKNLLAGVSGITALGVAGQASQTATPELSDADRD